MNDIRMRGDFDPTRTQEADGNRTRRLALALAGLGLAFAVPGPVAAAGEPDDTPRPSAEHVYASRDGVGLKVYVFEPPRPAGRPVAAVLVFHGGGWSMGEASWAFPAARHFAEQGAVGVAVQYRLSDRRSTTPLEAMADARDAFRWVRANASSLGVDPERVAGYGWSAGGHLVASAAAFRNDAERSAANPSPDAMVLNSPAVAVGDSSWFTTLLLGRVEPASASPDEHVRSGLPPALILSGDVDTVTPVDGSRRFCERMRQAGNVCELEVYTGYGHLFTPAGIPDDDWPRPDPATRAKAMARADRFLRGLGFLP